MNEPQNLKQRTIAAIEARLAPLEEQVLQVKTEMLMAQITGHSMDADEVVALGLRGALADGERQALEISLRLLKGEEKGQPEDVEPPRVVQALSDSLQVRRTDVKVRQAMLEGNEAALTWLDNFVAGTLN